jgi:hypothetical protein
MKNKFIKVIAFVLSLMVVMSGVAVADPVVIPHVGHMKRTPSPPDPGYIYWQDFESGGANDYDIQYGNLEQDLTLRYRGNASLRAIGELGASNWLGHAELISPIDLSGDESSIHVYFYYRKYFDSPYGVSMRVYLLDAAGSEIESTFINSSQYIFDKQWYVAGQVINLPPNTEKIKWEMTWYGGMNIDDILIYPHYE